MAREEELELFWDNLWSLAYTQYCQGTQYELECEQWERVEQEMKATLCENQQPIVEKWFETLLLAEGRKQSHAYRQGLQDMVFLLRGLGVLA